MDIGIQLSRGVAEPLRTPVPERPAAAPENPAEIGAAAAEWPLVLSHSGFERRGEAPRDTALVLVQDDACADSG